MFSKCTYYSVSLLLAIFLVFGQSCVLEAKNFTRVIQLGDSASAGTGTLKVVPKWADLESTKEMTDHKLMCYNNKAQSPGIRYAKETGAKPVMLACAGDTINELTEQQLKFLKDQKEDDEPLVVMTIGANDMAFELSASRVDQAKKKAQKAYGARAKFLGLGLEQFGAINLFDLSLLCQILECKKEDFDVKNFDVISHNLEDAYKEVIAILPNSTIRVLGYPAPAANANGLWRSCWSMVFHVSRAEADGVDSAITRLNKEISNAVMKVKDSREGKDVDIQFVDVSEEFAGGGACIWPTGKFINYFAAAQIIFETYTERLTVNPLNSFHPNAEGWGKYFKALRNSIK
eukprot:Plantae.Rhodophyta-Hildenbrandia_rubra.ctg28971.p1 GENE.Plantae.Rhodophyta-Hildenbrandia_rubra.ctg28971~~Plantae.Rhodophyta-Hildenbrandia_rubra.ctg28971.p1  ORF type:complete len:346 (-),score=44.31 Plantae.Rhodophyta-Hildenbrandia_rubra.ctg28971:1565-2602(-)